MVMERDETDKEQADIHTRLPRGCKSLRVLLRMPRRPWMELGDRRELRPGGGALRRPEDPTRRTWSQHPPGCWRTGAGALCSDD